MNSWVEKYRPDSLDDIVGQEGNIEIMRSFVEQEKGDKSELPHFLFSGPTGVGKTATAVAFAKDLWGDEWNSHWSDYNASDDRGIDTVRDEIKRVARQKGTSGDYRIIFLDEVDSMTDQAQKALRRTMEDYSDKTKFILSCNYPAQLLDAIIGRCVHRRFTPVDVDKLTEHLKWIADQENLEYEDEAIGLIAKSSDGLVRNAIQELQALGSTNKLTYNWVESQVNAITESEIEELFRLIRGTSNQDIRVKKVDEKVIEMYMSGVTPDEILKELYDYILDNHTHMFETLAKIGDIDANISQGANPLLQLRCFLFWLIRRTLDE